MKIKSYLYFCADYNIYQVINAILMNLSSVSICMWFFIHKNIIIDHLWICGKCYAMELTGSRLCIEMAQCKAAVTPLLTHWSYCSLAISSRLNVLMYYDILVTHPCLTLGSDMSCAIYILGSMLRSKCVKPTVGHIFLTRCFTAGFMLSYLSTMKKWVAIK